MKASALLDLIPADTFADLALTTRVDTQVKKLSGEIVFKLILYSMLNSDRLSLRAMEAFLNSAQFKSFTKCDIIDGKYNSLADRIANIDAVYFEKLFQKIFEIYNKELKEIKTISKTDSTYVGLASKLFRVGMKNGEDDKKRFVKYSVNLKGSLPSDIKIYTTQNYNSEEQALSELINDEKCLEENIVVFDRGLT